MKFHLKSIMLSLVALGLSHGLHAATKKTYMQNSRIAQNTMTPSTMNDQMMITPSASPVVTHGADIFVDADFIYWTARQDGLPYAFTGFINFEPGTAILPSSGTTGYVTPHGQEFYVNNKMDPGFKVGAGLDLGHDGWDNYLEYTWLHSHANGTTDQGEDIGGATLSSTVSPHYPDLDEPNYIGSAQGFWNFRFNNFDWELGRSFFVSPRLILRPHFGLKGTWQRQIMTAKYNDLYDLDSSDVRTDRGYYKSTFNQFYWGVGIRGGLDTSWQFDTNWSIYGDLALSALWGNFNVLRTDISSSINSTNPAINSTNATTVNSTRAFHSLREVLELSLGFRWDCWFSDDDYRLRIQAGWEEQIWFDQNNFAFGLNDNSGDPLFNNTNSSLVMQGLTVKFRFDF